MNVTLSEFLQLASVVVVISSVEHGLFRGVYYVVLRIIRMYEEHLIWLWCSCLQTISSLSSLRLSCNGGALT